MQISGTINNVIFRNAENGYTVVSIYTEGKLETAVGIFPPISEGETIELIGERIINKKYGEQIAVESVRTKPPTTPEGIIKYLSSDLFKGIGEVTAKRIVDKFGDKTFEIIEKEPILLESIPQITAVRAMEIGEKFIELRFMQESIIFLQQYDISLNLSIKIFKRYKATTQAIVLSNPYQLIYDIDGIGFFTADRIALKIGIEKDSPKRIKAAINYVLVNQATKCGNTYLPEEELIDEIKKLLSNDIEKSELIIKEIEELNNNRLIIVFEKNDKRCLMLRKYYELENEIAENLQRISKKATKLDINCIDDIRAFELFNNITLHDSQINAIIAAINSYGVVITGGPGTGKTTIIKCILSIFKSRGIQVALCAPTGRAAKRLSEATGENAMTIHRLLDLDFKNGKGSFNYNKDTKIEADVIIVDEVSMADEYVFNALINSIKTDGRLIIVGDKDQLPSVGAGNVLSDIIESNIFKVMELTEIYRQESESYIITNAHRINKGKMPILNSKDKDFFFINTDNLQKIVDNVKSLASQRLPKYLNISPNKIQVLCPMKKGIAWVVNLNHELQKALNSNEKTEILLKEGKYRIGDKVIQLSNNYQIIWTKSDGESGEGVFNGDIGIIESIDKKKIQLSVRFDDDKLVEYSAGDLDQLALAYAITIHKSQGSEFEAVIVAIAPGSNTILTRNLLYTAITRAKNLVILIGNKKTISYMVSNNYTAKRYTCLVDFIRKLENE